MDHYVAMPLTPLATLSILLGSKGYRLVAHLHDSFVIDEFTKMTDCTVQTAVTAADSLHGRQTAQSKRELEHGSISMSAVEEMRHFLGLSEHVSKHWRCPRCEQALSLLLLWLLSLSHSRTHSRCVCAAKQRHPQPSVPYCRAPASCVAALWITTWQCH